MNYIQKLILDTREAMPQHFETVLARNQDVVNYVDQNVPKSIGNFLEQLYYAVYMEDNPCTNGNSRPMTSWGVYGFCAPAGQCACASADSSIGHYQVLTTEQIAQREQAKQDQKSNNDLDSVDQATRMAILKDQSMLSELAKTMKPHEISKALGVGMSTVYRYLNQHGLR